jgi:hypothetical protein
MDNPNNLTPMNYFNSAIEKSLTNLILHLEGEAKNQKE